MKRLITPSIIILLFLSNISNINAQSWLWASTGNYDDYSHLVTMKKDHAGNFYVATFQDSIGSTLRSRLDKMDSTMTNIWRLEFSGDVVITDVEINSLNHTIVTGYFQDTLTLGIFILTSPFHHSAFIFEANEAGDYTWGISFNPVGDEFRPVDLFVDKQDQIYITAENSIDGFCSFHKFDLWGGHLLSEFPGNANTDVRTFSHILADDSGNVYVSGTCGIAAMFDSIPVTLPASYQNMLVKYDANFNAQWLISRTYITFDHNNSLCSDGQSLFWSFNEASSTADSARIVRTDFNGQILGDVAGPMGHSFFPSVFFNIDSTGNGVLGLSVFNRLYLFGYDNQLNLLWNDSIYTHHSGFPAEHQILCEDSSFYVCSKYWGDSLQIGSLLLLNPNGGTSDYDIFLAKWGPGSSVGVNEFERQSLSLWPNPAGEFLNVMYEGNSEARLTILDGLGKVCFTKSIILGENRIVLSMLSEGLYSVKVEDGKADISVSKLVINR